MNVSNPAIATAEEINVLYPLIPDLDNTKLHSPEVREQHRQAFHDRLARIAAHQNAIQQADSTAKAKANAPMTDEELYQEALKEQEALMARNLQREVEAAAAVAAKKAQLAERPAEVTVCTPNVMEFLQDIEHWCSIGYRIDLHRALIGMTLYDVTLVAPAKKAKPQ